MKHGKLCISRPEMKLHKDFCPVIRKNHSFLESISVLMAGNLSFAKQIIDKYSGQFFYDFDFGSFVFLARLMQTQTGEQKQEDTADMSVKDSQKRWEFLEKQPVNMLYITSPQFQKTVRHLTVENKIFPAKTRLAADFYRQTLVWERIREILRDEKIPIVNYSDVQAIRRGSSGEKNQQELPEVEQSDQLRPDIRQSFGKLMREQKPKPKAIRVLESLIERKKVFEKIYEKVNMELHKHNFKKFEDEKLCFLGVIKTFEENSGENQGITDLLYRIDSASETQLESIKSELMEAGQSVKRLGRLKAYLEEKGDLSEKPSVSEAFLGFMYTADGRQLSEQLRRYSHLLKRHTVIETALENYRQLLETHSEIDFAGKKIQLLNILTECRTQNQRLFTEFLDVEKILTQVPKQLFDAGILPGISVEEACFDTLSEHIVKKIESADVDTWRQIVQRRSLISDTEQIRVQGEQTYPSAAASEMWTERVDKTVELLTVLSALRTNVDDLRKLVPEDKDEFEEFFNVPGIESADRRYIRKLLTMAFEKSTITKAYMKVVQGAELSGVIKKLYEAAPQVKMQNQMRSYLGIVMVREFLENLRAASGEIEKTLALEEAHRETVENYINYIVETDVEPMLAAEDNLSETEKVYNERRLFRQWFFEIHQWQERRVALAQIYETLNREYGAQIFDEKTVKMEEINKRKAYFLDMLCTHQERHSAVWHTEALTALRQFTMNTKLGRQMMSVFSLNQQAMVSSLTDIFSENVRENLQKMEHRQWLELWKILSLEYADSEKLVTQRTSMEETFRMLEAAQEIYTTFEKNIESQKNAAQPPQAQGIEASALPYGAPDTAQPPQAQDTAASALPYGVPDITLLSQAQGADAFALTQEASKENLSASAPQLFANTVRNYLKTHSEIEKLIQSEKLIKAEQLMQSEKLIKAEQLIQSEQQSGQEADLTAAQPGAIKLDEVENIVFAQLSKDNWLNESSFAAAQLLHTGQPGHEVLAAVPPEHRILLSNITQMFSEKGLREIENYTDSQWEQFLNHVEKVYLMPQTSGNVKQHEMQSMTEAADIKTSDVETSSAERIVQQSREAVWEIYKAFLETAEKTVSGSRERKNGAPDIVQLPQAQGADAFALTQEASKENLSASAPQLFASTVRNYLKTHSEIEKLIQSEKLIKIEQVLQSEKLIEAEQLIQPEQQSGQEAVLTAASQLESIKPGEVENIVFAQFSKDNWLNESSFAAAQLSHTGQPGHEALAAAPPEHRILLSNITQMFSEEGLREIENYTDSQWEQFLDHVEKVYLMPQTLENVKQHEMQSMTETADIKIGDAETTSAERIVQQSREAVREIYKVFLETAEKTVSGSYERKHGARDTEASALSYGAPGIAQSPQAQDNAASALPYGTPDITLLSQAQGADAFALTQEASKEDLSASAPKLFASTVRNYLKTHSEIEKLIQSEKLIKIEQVLQSEKLIQSGQEAVLTAASQSEYRILLSNITQMFSEEGLREIENYTNSQWEQFTDHFREIQQIWENTFYAGTETGIVHRKDMAERAGDMHKWIAGSLEAAEAAEKSELPAYSRLMYRLQKAQSEQKNGQAWSEQKNGQAQSEQENGQAQSEQQNRQATETSEIEMREIRDMRNIRIYKDIKDRQEKRTLTFNEAAYRQTKLQKETISRLEKIIEEQKVQVAQLLKNQEEAKTLAVTRQKTETPVSESEMFGRFMGQFQEELRMERMRRRL